MADEHELRELVLAGREERNLEYKQSEPWGSLQLKVVKAALALANLPSGGFLVIGMRRDGGEYRADGVAEEDLQTYSEDDVQAQVNRYADPYVTIRLDIVHLGEKSSMVMSVDAFHDVPVICRRDGPPELKRGRLYYRSRRMRESTEIQNSSDMRELIELATERALMRYERLHTASTHPATTVATSDREKFDSELRGL